MYGWHATAHIREKPMPPKGTENKTQDQTRMEALINAAFRREITRRVTDVILPLNDIGTGSPFYCVHSIAGVATEFQHLVRMLGPSQNFYGIQVPSTRRNAQFASIKEMSKSYVDELVKFQPAGAFFLGGYSIGATIALEMAEQLTARGRKVGLLVVFDGELFNTGADISPRSPLYWLKLIANVPRWIANELVRNRIRFADKTVNRVKSVALTVRRRNTPRPHAVERFVDLVGFPPEHAAFVKQFFDDQRAYVPDRYSGRVLVFVAKTHALLHLRQVKAAWTKIAPLSEVCEISGTHVSIMRMPQGRVLAERLRKTIEEIDN
jgi:thioesterase domain-containing protein